MSSVISMQRKERNIRWILILNCLKYSKSRFNQRRKMLRNGLSGIVSKEMLQQDILQNVRNN